MHEFLLSEEDLASIDDKLFLVMPRRPAGGKTLHWLAWSHHLRLAHIVLLGSLTETLLLGPRSEVGVKSTVIPSYRRTDIDIAQQYVNNVAITFGCIFKQLQLLSTS